jgi:hypothetical protein
MTRRTIDFGELRSLLNEPPSEWAWQQLCALVFPWELEACAEQWLPYAEDMLDRGWPDALRVWPQRWMANRQPSAAQLVRALRLTSPTRAQTAQVYAALTRHAPPITTLALKPRLNGDEASLVTGLLEAMPTLDALELTGFGLLQPARWRLLTETPTMERLERLELSGTAQHVDGVTALLARGARLRALRIEAAPHGWDAGLAQTIVAHDAHRRIESLRLSGLSVETLGELAALPWERLRRLDLRVDLLGDDALLSLLAALRGVETLALGHIWPGLRLGEAFEAADEGLRVRELRLDHNGQLDDAQLARALRSPALSQLERLWLNQAPGDAALEALASVHGERLRGLHIHRPHQTAPTLRGARMELLLSAPWSALEVLELCHMGLDDAALEQMSRAELPALRALHIGQHPRPSWPDEAPISTRGQERLAEAPWFPRLHTLGLGDNINAHGILSGLSRHPRADKRLRRHVAR